MKFSSTCETLTAKLQQLAALAPSRLGAEAFMAQMKIEADAESLKFTATDGELELSAQVRDGVNVETPGQAYVPARQMASFYASLAGEEVVEVNTVAGSTTCKAASSDLSLNAIGEGNVKLFPSEKAEAGTSFNIPRQELQEVLNKTAFAMASGDVRYYLNGMLLELKDGALRAVSTDAHRLAFASRACEVSTRDAEQKNAAEAEETRCIVPRKAIQELTRLLSGARDVIQLTVSEHRLVAELGDYRLMCRLVDGRYPDYTKVVPQDNQIKAVIDKTALQASMRRAYIVAEEDPGKTANLRFTPDWLHIEASSPQQHKIKEKIPVHYTGQGEMRIAFNASYVLEYLNTSQYDKIQIDLKDNESRSILRGEGEESAFYLLMPVLL